MSNVKFDDPSTLNTAKPSARRKGGWIAAGVIGLLVVIGAGPFSGDSPSAATSSNVYDTSSENVATAAAEAAWGARTTSEQADVCALYEVDSATALAAIDSGVGGNDPDLLAAFDDLLSRSC